MLAPYFENLYAGEDIIRPTLEGIVFPLVQEDLKTWLERDFDEEEISKGLPNCAGNKAPGREGLNFTFLKASWDIIKGNFCCMLSECHQRGKLNKEINSTFLCMIPKAPNPDRFKDFRPIILVGYNYKLLSKTLENRQRKALPNIISPTLGAFIHKSKFWKAF